jgi:signal transduction histidine kinase/GAF domain-containing protein
MKDPDLSQILEELGKLSETLVSASPAEFYQVFPAAVCKLLNVPICILWVKQPEESKFKIVATHGEVDESYKQLELDAAHPSIGHILAQRDKILSLFDVSQAAYRLVHIDEILARKWASLLTATLKVDNKQIGILNTFTTETRHFNDWEKNLFNILANEAIAFLEKHQLIDNKEEIDGDRKRLKDMTNIMRKMTDATMSQEVWDLLYNGALKILQSDTTQDIRILLAKIDHLTGRLDIIRSSDKYLKNSNILPKLGKGIITRAIKEQKIIRDNDVLNNKDYFNTWKDARSEIVVPLMDKILIRDGKKVQEGSKKCIGVLNIESSIVNAFSERYEKRISLLADDASIRLERLNLYQKIYKVRELEKEIGKSQDYDTIIDKIIKGITEILQFEWVNISFVNAETNIIKSEYVVGIDKDLIEDFKRDAEHRLSDNDIQADVIRNKEIEVPKPNDRRFDRKIYKKYGHNKLIRVFLPIVEPSSNQAIGTVEAGYRREYREHIYEQDVIILKSLVDYAAHALEHKKSRLIDRITHELQSPIVGIRSNASFIQMRFSDVRVSEKFIAIKLEDILTDCELLLYQVRQFEYFLGRTSSDIINREEVFVFRDIIIKTIYQLKSYIQEEYSFSFDKIHYNVNDSKRVIISTDKMKLNQVVFNLLINAFKYAEKDPENFKIFLEVDENKNNYIIKFKDWGIGIKESDKNRIFEEGFRSREAISKVGGSGLGLNISRTIVRQLGGDLTLANNAKPTEFHLILPKNT